MIYFLRALDGGPIKIGCSVRPKIRCREVAYLARKELRILGVMPGDRAAERALHRRFLASRAEDDWRCEWFEPTAELLDLIAAEARPWEPSDDIPYPKYGFRFNWQAELRARGLLNCEGR